MRKKLFAVIMSVMMMVTFMPAMAFAAEYHTGADHALTAEVSGWSADYSKAYVDVYCAGCRGAKVASTSVDTKREFVEGDSNGYIKVEVGASDIEKAAADQMKALYDKATSYSVDFTNVDKEAGILYKDTAVTSYYDFTDAVVVNAAGNSIEEMMADNYLEFLTEVPADGSYRVKFTEPSSVDSFDKKAKYGYVDLKVAKKDVKHGYDIISTSDDGVKKDANNEYNFGYFYMYLKKAEKVEASLDYNVEYNFDKNPDVRIDMVFPEYTPYLDGVTLDVPVQFRAYSHIEPVHVYGLTTDKTQKIKITTANLRLDHQILNSKAATEPNTKPQKVEVYDTEKEALREGMLYQKYINSKVNKPANLFNATYIGEDIGFEVTTQNVSVEYGTIDDLGNVTYSATAPEIINRKYEQDGYYHDKDYHFIVKISKGSQTVYMPVEVIVKAASIKVDFVADEFYAGVGEKLNKEDLVKVTVGDGKHAYAADMAIIKQFIEKYGYIEGLDTSFKHSAYLSLGVDTSVTEKELKGEFGEQFIANFSYPTPNATRGPKLYVTDQNNNIRVSNKIKTFHVKNAAKLKSTKKFQLKAKATYGNVTFKKITAKYAKIQISKNGKVTVKKGLKKGTYKVKVQVAAPCKQLRRTVVVKVVK